VTSSWSFILQLTRNVHGSFSVIRCNVTSVVSIRRTLGISHRGVEGVTGSCRQSLGCNRRWLQFGWCIPFILLPNG